MSQNKQTDLAALYRGWPTDKLVDAARLHRNEYTPEAIAQMRAELKDRGLPETQFEEAEATAPKKKASKGFDYRMFIGCSIGGFIGFKLVCLIPGMERPLLYPGHVAPSLIAGLIAGFMKFKRRK